MIASLIWSGYLDGFVTVIIIFIYTLSRIIIDISCIACTGSTSCMGSGGASKSNSYQRRLEHSWYTSFENEHRLYYHVKKPLLEVSAPCVSD